MVTTNPLVRGVIQALNWLQTKQGYRLQTFTALPEAIAWLEGERAGKLALSPLLAEAHAALNRENRSGEAVRRSVPP